MNIQNQNVPKEPYAYPIAGRGLVIGVSTLTQTRRNISLSTPFGMSFTKGPVFQIPKLLVDLPGVLNAEVAFDQLGTLDVLVVKVKPECFSVVLDSLSKAYEGNQVDTGTLFWLHDQVIHAEPEGYSGSSCLTFMTRQFFKARSEVLAAANTEVVA